MFLSLFVFVLLAFFIQDIADWSLKTKYCKNALSDIANWSLFSITRFSIEKSTERTVNLYSAKKWSKSMTLPISDWPLDKTLTLFWLIEVLRPEHRQKYVVCSLLLNSCYYHDICVCFLMCVCVYLLIVLMCLLVLFGILFTMNHRN